MSWDFLLLVQLLANMPGEAVEDGPCHPCRRLEWNSSLFTLAWPGPASIVIWVQN